MPRPEPLTWVAVSACVPPGRTAPNFGFCEITRPFLTRFE